MNQHNQSYLLQCIQTAQLANQFSKIFNQTLSTPKQISCPHALASEFKQAQHQHVTTAAHASQLCTCTHKSSSVAQIGNNANSNVNLNIGGLNSNIINISNILGIKSQATTHNFKYTSNRKTNKTVSKTVQGLKKTPWLLNQIRLVNQRRETSKHKQPLYFLTSAVHALSAEKHTTDTYLSSMPHSTSLGTYTIKRLHQIASAKCLKWSLINLELGNSKKTIIERICIELGIYNRKTCSSNFLINQLTHVLHMKQPDFKGAILVLEKIKIKENLHSDTFNNIRSILDEIALYWYEKDVTFRIFYSYSLPITPTAEFPHMMIF